MKDALRNIANGALMFCGFFLGFGAIAGVVIGGLTMFLSDWHWYYKLLASLPVAGFIFWCIGRQWRRDFNHDVWTKR